MSNNNDLPTTSRRQVVGGVNNEAASRKLRKLIKRERVSKKEKRKILGPRGEIEVDVNPGDTIVTITFRDGTVEQNVERTSSNSSSTKSSKSSTAKSSNSSGLKSLKLLKRMVPSARKSSPDMSLHNRTLDLAFINDYINNDVKDKRNELNIALAKKPNKNALYKVIWKGLSPYNTAERSAEDHKYINTLNAGTPDEIGSMNWEAATGKKGPNFSIEDFTPEYNRWTAGFNDVTLRTPISTPASVPLTSSAVTLLVPKYSDRFKSLYDYAKTHNGAFDYSSNAFDLSGLVNNTNYGGIGDFMDAYGLNPLELYKMLENIYEPQ